MTKSNGLDVKKEPETATMTPSAETVATSSNPSQAAVAPTPQKVPDTSLNAQKTPEKEPEKAPQAEPDKKPFVSAGKTIHNEITYRGIDWLVNSAVGISFAYWSSRTHSGQKYFTKPVTNFFKTILKPVMKSEQSLEEGAKWGTMFASIMAGGTTIIPVMMAMENKTNKKGIIKWLDEKWYGKEAVANNPQFEESYKAIDNEPHKSFAIGMASRFAALAPLIAMSVYSPTNKVLIKHVYDPIGTGSKWVAKKVGIKPSAEMLDPLKGALEHIEGDPNIPKRMMSNWDFLHRTIGFDLGLTFLYSFLHEVAYKGLAKMGVKETDNDTQKGQQFTPSGIQITSPASIAPEIDLIEHSSPLMEKVPAQQSFASKVKPKTNMLAEPSGLHTERLVTKELAEDAHVWDRANL